MIRRFLVLAVVGLTLAPACSTDNRRPELRRLLDDAPYTLRESVSVAVGAVDGNAERGTLVTSGDPQFAVKVLGSSATADVRVSAQSGDIVSTVMADPQVFACPEAISLVDALAIAEAAADGEAIQSVPDDDVRCAFEIQVLSGIYLIEVKVAPDGRVLEIEPSDEFGGGEDD